ncbi:MAG: hypothetical protein PHE83_11465 [Opitutaceae bacterium]|nr:hypothetical protein [Opitutaceae bacterium]
MKTVRLALLTLVLTAVRAAAGEPSAADPADAYAQAVNSYVSAAEQQLVSIRVQVDAEVKPAAADGKQRYAPVYAKLEQCDKLLAELKEAGSADFDKIKADFERARDEMVKALAAARQQKPATDR